MATMTAQMRRDCQSMLVCDEAMQVLAETPRLLRLNDLEARHQMIKYCIESLTCQSHSSPKRCIPFVRPLAGS